MTVTVSVTEALVLRPLLEDQGRITVNPPGNKIEKVEPICQ